MGFVDFALDTDLDDLLALFQTRIQAAFPDWEPDENHLEWIVAQGVAWVCSEVSALAGNVPNSIFRAYGSKVVQIPPQDGAPAAALFTITAIDDAGYTFHAGEKIGYRLAGDQLAAFTTDDDIVIPPGDTEVSGAVFHALDATRALNDIPAVTAFELIDSLAWIDSVVSDTVTGGGADPETDDAYMARLSDELTLLTDTPILADDFARLARKVEGVHRALGLENYNPDDDSFGNERMVTVALVDVDGNPVSGTASDAVISLLEAKREQNFIANVMDPTYTEIDIVFEITVKADFTGADVVAAAEAAVTSYISPATWGDPSARDPFATPLWEVSGTLYLWELTSVINNVTGVDRVTLLTISKNDGAPVSADVVLTGRAPLISAVGGGEGSSVAGSLA